MRNKLFTSFLTLCLGISIVTQAQSTIYSCNGKYRIVLSNKLELQSSELNSIRNVMAQNQKPQVAISTPSGHITFQQKGLNANVKSAYNKYCRVIIEYFKEPKNNPVFGRGEQIVVDKDILYAVNESARRSCQQSGTPFIKLISVEGITINGFPTLYYSYKRKGWEGKQPPVIVNVYRIFNRYESVNLIFSYREAERENWRDIHSYIIKSFCFTQNN